MWEVAIFFIPLYKLPKSSLRFGGPIANIGRLIKCLNSTSEYLWRKLLTTTPLIADQSAIGRVLLFCGDVWLLCNAQVPPLPVGDTGLEGHSYLMAINGLR